MVTPGRSRRPVGAHGQSFEKLRVPMSLLAIALPWMLNIIQFSPTGSAYHTNQAADWSLSGQSEARRMVRESRSSTGAMRHNTASPKFFFASGHTSSAASTEVRPLDCDAVLPVLPLHPASEQEMTHSTRQRRDKTTSSHSHLRWTMSLNPAFSVGGAWPVSRIAVWSGPGMKPEWLPDDEGDEEHDDHHGRGNEEDLTLTLCGRRGETRPL